MTVFPFRFRELAPDSILFVNDAGDYFLGNEEFLDRAVFDKVTSADKDFLELEGFPTDSDGTAFAQRWTRRFDRYSNLSYLILVPTLRCNLSCGYCQVSRVAEFTRGFDWTTETADATLEFLSSITSKEIKIEFQGGEPLLRLDLLDRVRSFCRNRFAQSEFVVCTNLQEVSEDAWEFLAAPDTHVSTSLDGDVSTHQRQRTGSAGTTAQFNLNIKRAVQELGLDNLSALPTIDIENPPAIQTLLQAYQDLGFQSIYLRPINHQGFARKNYGTDHVALWRHYYCSAIDHLIEHNAASDHKFEEYYFSFCLKRVLGQHGVRHVDLRNPAFYGMDYLVIDHDGSIYPSDEARMLARIRHVNLSIGSVQSGLDRPAIAKLHSAAINNFNEDCIHCAYQPFCGSDFIDDLSRYHRIDKPRHETWFCQRHLGLFDKLFQLMYSKDPKVQKSLSLWAGVESWPQDLVPVHR